MSLTDRIIFLTISLVSAYAVWRFFRRYRLKKTLHDTYYALAYLSLLAAGLVIMIAGYTHLSSPWMLLLVSLIPISLSVGLVRQFYPDYKRVYAWFSALGLVLILIGAFTGNPLRVIAILVFHGFAGLVILGVPVLSFLAGRAPHGFWWISVGVLLIAIVDLPRSFLNAGRQLLFFSPEVIASMLAPLLLLSTLAITWGFMKDAVAALE